MIPQIFRLLHIHDDDCRRFASRDRLLEELLASHSINFISVTSQFGYLSLRIRMWDPWYAYFARGTSVSGASPDEKISTSSAETEKQRLIKYLNDPYLRVMLNERRNLNFNESNATFPGLALSLCHDVQMGKQDSDAKMKIQRARAKLLNTLISVMMYCTSRTRAKYFVR